MKKIHNVEQRSDEWFKLREKYILTASEAQAIGNQGKGLESLCWDKLAEKYSSAIRENFVNKDLERGVELEPQAISIYELKTGNKVDKIGFVTDDKISKVGGASPDGAVGEDGNIEVKCFADTKYFKMIVEFNKTDTFEIESGYVWQMQMQMLFTDTKWTDFLAYNPNFKQSLLIKRIYQDKEMHAKIIEGLKKGEQIIKEIESNLK
jgi:putative phage-type endonuclease